jgi:hypothetical protein
MWARARRHRFAVASLLGLIVLAQAGLVVHRIQHAATANNLTCALCAAADHVPAPAGTVLHCAALFMLVERQSFTALLPVVVRFELPYQTRAPPRRRIAI